MNNRNLDTVVGACILLISGCQLLSPAVMGGQRDRVVSSLVSESTGDVYSVVWDRATGDDPAFGDFALRRLSPEGEHSWEGRFKNPAGAGVPRGVLADAAGGIILLLTQRESPGNIGDIWLWDTTGTLLFTSPIQGVSRRLLVLPNISTGAFRLIYPVRRRNSPDNIWAVESFGPSGRIDSASIVVSFYDSLAPVYCDFIPDRIVELPTGYWHCTRLKPDDRADMSIYSWLVDPKTGRISAAMSIELDDLANASSTLTLPDVGLSRIYFHRKSPNRISYVCFVMQVESPSTTNKFWSYFKISVDGNGRLLNEKSAAEPPRQLALDEIGEVEQRIVVQGLTDRNSLTLLEFNSSGDYANRRVNF